jgi:hypothetical protein
MIWINFIKNTAKERQGMSEKKVQMNTEVSDFLGFLCRWHKNRIDALKTIVDDENEDSVIVLNGINIDPDSEVARGIRIGVACAIEALGKLPFHVEAEVRGEDG